MKKEVNQGLIFVMMLVLVVGYGQMTAPHRKSSDNYSNGSAAGDKSNRVCNSGKDKKYTDDIS